MVSPRNYLTSATHGFIQETFLDKNQMPKLDNHLTAKYNLIKRDVNQDLAITVNKLSNILLEQT